MIVILHNRCMNYFQFLLIRLSLQKKTNYATVSTLVSPEKRLSLVYIKHNDLYQRFDCGN